MARSNWASSAMLMCLLAADTVFAYPKPGETDSASFVTQFPPEPTNGRILLTQDVGYYPKNLDGDVRGPSSNPLGGSDPDSDFDSWINSSFFDDDDDKDLKTGQPTVATVTGVKPTSTKAAGIDFDAPLANGDDEPSTAGTTTTASDPENVHNTNLPEATEGGRKPSKTGFHKGTGDPHLTMSGQDAFVPVATGGIPQNIKSRDDHPVQKQGVGNTTKPIQTNKFYSAIFLGSQTNATFCHPYVLAWAKGSGNASSYGMAVSHTEQDKLAEGEPNNKMPGSPVAFYVNPVGIQSVILSATELDSSTVLTAEDPKPFSANAVLRPRNSPQRNITIPVLQGMGYVTGIYTDLQPLLQTGVLFRKVVSAGSPKPGIYKYQAYLEDGSTWLMYATPNDGKDPKFHLESHTKLRGPEHWSGVLQVTKNPAGHGGEKLFDNSAGVFPVQGVISGAVANRDGQYSLSWYKAGKDAHSTPLIMFAMPHHIKSFDNTTHGRMVDIHLRTTTKGNATAVIGEQWTMVEPELPIEMGFGPWSPKGAYVSPDAKKVILEAAKKDLDEDFDQQSDLNSMYFSGKALSKFATLVYTTSEVAGDKSLAASGLEKLKNSFARFVENRQQFPLVYDTVWKGVVSSASYGSGDVGADFGNTLYNDHHFHYGYFIHAAAIIGHLEPNWLNDNKDWVNMLVRDAGNPSADDPKFPFSRAFDWFHGHSWAKGLFESFDGKDQESTSEDTMFAYAVKMWGKTIGDASMEARGNLMLGVLRRSLHNYFLLESDNKNHVPNFVPNKVTGILFENKVDHTTYFGNNMEYVHGIHMLPLMPASPFVRNRKFVAQEWNAVFAGNASTPANKVEGGWQGVLYANLALVDPETSWKYFSRSGFDYGSIDGGATRTWYLAFAAASTQLRSTFRNHSWGRRRTSTMGSNNTNERTSLVRNGTSAYGGYGGSDNISSSNNTRNISANGLRNGAVGDNKPPGHWTSWPLRVVQVTWATVVRDYVNLLLVFVPLGLLAGKLDWPVTATFTLNFFAIIPLASLLSFATEELAATMGQALGGLLNATFGNAVELIVSIIALKNNQIRVVQASMLGSILSNILLVLGCCFFVGGLRFSQQSFNSTVASTMSSLMTVSSASLIIPATLYSTLWGKENDDKQHKDAKDNVLLVSRGTAIVLLILYVMYLYFQLRSHASLFEEVNDGLAEDSEAQQHDLRSTVAENGDVEAAEEPEEERVLSPLAAGVALVVVTVLVSFCADYLVDSIDGIVAQTGMSRTFIGLVLIPIVGNAAEHVTAVVVAWKDKMDLAIGVAIGSSLQIALFVTPFLVILGWIMHVPMSLRFEPFETVAFFISGLVVTFLIQDGKSNYLEGGLCLGMYFILALSFYVYPDNLADQI